MKKLLALALIGLLWIAVPQTYAQVPGDVGTIECRLLQLAVQGAVGDEDPVVYRNHGAWLSAVSNIVRPEKDSGAITPECASCIVHQFARRVPIAGQTPCGPTPCAGVFDLCIDADGTASPGDGIPAAAQVIIGTPLQPFPTINFIGSGLDMFDNDGNSAWTFDTDGPGPLGDDIHVEDFTFCPTAIRDGVHDLGLDCVVLDQDGSFFQGQFVSCDLEVGAFCVPPLPSPISYHDANGNLAWDDGEDIVLDINGNLVFD